MERPEGEARHIIYTDITETAPDFRIEWNTSGMAKPEIQLMSVACAAMEHDRCDGSSPGNAKADPLFLASLPEGERWCGCFCHRRPVYRLEGGRYRGRHRR